jgi:hypothetical protein
MPILNKQLNPLITKNKKGPEGPLENKPAEIRRSGVPL